MRPSAIPSNRRTQRALRSIVITAHKYLALVCVVFWTLQIISGLLLSFHRELDDVLLGARVSAIDPAVLDTAAARLAARSHGKVTAIYRSGVDDDQLDFVVKVKAGVFMEFRVRGSDGAILRAADRDNIWGMAWPRLLASFHEKLLMGAVGEWIVCVSGVLLLLTIVLGMVSGWPRKGVVIAAYFPKIRAGTRASHYALHRAVGLWVSPILLVTVVTGLLQLWSSALSPVFGTPWAKSPEVTPLQKGDAIVSIRTAMQTARNAVPAGLLSIVYLPAAESATYRIRLREPGEMRQVFGTTVVFVDGRSGRLLQVDRAADQPIRRKMFMALFPLHNGEWGGRPGKLLALVVGLGALWTACAGIRLWFSRRRVRRGSET